LQGLRKRLGVIAEMHGSVNFATVISKAALTDLCNQWKPPNGRGFDPFARNKCFLEELKTVVFTGSTKCMILKISGCIDFLKIFYTCLIYRIHTHIFILGVSLISGSWLQ
jgi:hypothetical protein